MGKIICLMGKSSSGKDTIYKNLMEDKSLGLRKLIPYTTRPMREGEAGRVWNTILQMKPDLHVFRKKTG